MRVPNKLLFVILFYGLICARQCLYLLCTEAEDVAIQVHVHVHVHVPVRVVNGASGPSLQRTLLNRVYEAWVARYTRNLLRVRSWCLTERYSKWSAVLSEK